MAWITGRMNAVIRDMSISYGGFGMEEMMSVECDMSFIRPSSPEDLENVVQDFRAQLLSVFFPGEVPEEKPKPMLEKKPKAKKEEPKPEPGVRDIEFKETKDDQKRV